MLTLIHDLTLHATAEWYPPAWKGVVILPDGTRVWRDTILRTYRDAANHARAEITEFLEHRPRCNAQGCTNAPEWVDEDTLRDDGLYGTTWYCSEQCRQDVRFQ